MGSALFIWGIGTIPLNIASGGPAGGQAFDTLDRQALNVISSHMNARQYADGS